MEQFQQNIYKCFVIFTNPWIESHLQVLFERVLTLFYFIFMSLSVKVVAVFRIKNKTFDRITKKSIIVKLMKFYKKKGKLPNLSKISKARYHAPIKKKESKVRDKNFIKFVKQKEKERAERRAKRIKPNSPEARAMMIAGRRLKQQKWGYNDKKKGWY